LSLNITISKPVSGMTITIYTAAFRRVMEMPVGASADRDAIITVPAWRFGRLAAGTYYIVVTGISAGNEKAISRPVILLILK
jgi:hypothetical protein